MGGRPVLRDSFSGSGRFYHVVGTADHAALTGAHDRPHSKTWLKPNDWCIAGLTTNGKYCRRSLVSEQTSGFSAACSVRRCLILAPAGMG
jgi:hypothetical protein